MTRREIFEDEFSKLYNIVANQIEVSHASRGRIGLTEYAKTLLLSQGYLFYNSFTDDVYTGAAYGIDKYGREKMCTIRTEDGKQIGTFSLSYDKDDGVKKIKWRRDGTSLMPHLKLIAGELADCRLSATQNVVACRSPRVWRVRSRDYKQTIKEMVRESNEGEPNIIIDNTDGIDTIDFNYSFLSPEFHELHRRIFSEFLEEYGYPLTPNKRERVQSDEITANAVFSNDNLSQIIDFINEQCEAYGVPLKASISGSIQNLVETEGAGNEGT